MSQTLERARLAVFVTFVANGVAVGSWISRTPAVRDTLDLTTSGLGLLLLCVSAGSLVALPLSGSVVHRHGSARTVLGGSVGVAFGLALTTTGLARSEVPLTAVGLVLVGLGSGVWDVAMNVEGTAVERGLDRPLLPRLHAGWSVGTVIGALIGAGAAGVGITVQVQLVATAALVGTAVTVAVRAFLVLEPTAEPASPPLLARAWLDPRTLLIGVLALAFAFTEGAANDWLAITLVDGLGHSEALGAIGFGFFVAAMTLGRTFGGSALPRYGRVLVLRVSAVVALVGLLLVVLAPSLGLVLAGAGLWGFGAALGFPVAISAAADDPGQAAVRVSVVTSIGYTAFFVGPPLIGFLADAAGVRKALLVVGVALVLAMLTAGRARPGQPGQPGRR